MVKKMIVVNNITDRLNQIITERIYTYYPELTKVDIEIRKKSKIKKLHKSMIYQFNICNNGNILKTLVVKKRIFNPAYNNDIVKSTKTEFENLRLMNSSTNGKFSFPKVLDMLPEEGILISEKVEGETLSSYLRSSSYLPMTKFKKIFLQNLFIKIGLWLREFHRENSTGQRDKVDTQDYIRKAEGIVDKFPSFGISEDLGNAIINRMKTLKGDVLNYTFPLASKHGDFQPMNIIYHKDKLTILDISSQRKDITIKDVCSFIVGVSTFDIKSFYSFLDKESLNSLIVDFLNTYFEREPIPYQVIEFLKYVGMLQSFAFAYKRNPSFIRRRCVVSFYKKKLKELCA